MAVRPQILVPYSGPPNQADLNFLRLAEFCGIHGDRLQILDDEAAGVPAPSSKSDRPSCIAMSAKTMRSLLNKPAFVSWADEHIFSEPMYLLVYGFGPTDGRDKLLDWLTSGLIGAVKRLDTANARYEISSGDSAVCQQMSGITFGPALPDNDYLFVETSKDPAIAHLIDIAKQPFFVSLKRGPCRMFLVAGEDIADISCEWKDSLALDHFFSRLVPYLMFIRFVFGELCWHAPNSYASLIIDDPLLKGTYGSLDYSRLLKEMDRHGFFTNIAFIPYNRRRSRRKTVDLFLRRPDRYAICIHGCDHTKAEFGDTRLDVLEERTRRASLWMRVHTSRTGIPFERVMVFPQGIFSREAMRVLKHNGFLAAANSEVLPRNPAGGLSLAHLLEPAVTAFEGFPLYLRRYPDNFEGFALDLLLGKPALIVVHPDEFWAGYEKFGDLIKRINSLRPGISWASLGDIVSRTCLVRQPSAGTVQMRLYSSDFILENQTDHLTEFILSKKEPEGSIIDRVEFMGTTVPHRVESAEIFASFMLGPKAAGRVNIVYKREDEKVYRHPGLWHSTRVLIRRALSEFRDEYVSSNRFAQSLWTKIRKVS